MRSLLVPVALASLLASAASAEESSPKFGKQGQVVPLGAISITSASSSRGGDPLISTLVAPGLLYFVADGFLVSGNFSYQRMSQGTSYVSSHGFNLGGGASFDLGDRVSVVPQVQVGFTSTDLTTNTSRTSTVVGGQIPILVHLAPHFFFGFGPTLSIEVSVSDPESSNPGKATVLGLQTLLGGWF